MSEITSRGDCYKIHVQTVNEELRHHLSNSRVKIISHDNQSSSHQHDNRHLRRNKCLIDSLSGVQLFAKTLFESHTRKSMNQINIYKMLRHFNRAPFSFQRTAKSPEKVNALLLLILIPVLFKRQIKDISIKDTPTILTGQQYPSNVRVQPSKIEDIQQNLKDLLHEDLEAVIIHAGTNNEQRILHK